MKELYSKIILFISILSFVFSCTNDSNKSETVDLEEFLPQAKKEYNYKEDTVVQTEEHIPDSIELFIQSRISNSVFVQKEQLSNNKHFPDRLDFQQKYYHELTVDSVLYELAIWEFEDSLHTVNAFYNWMDCFGEKCKSLRIGESKWMYKGAFQLFVGDTKLIYIATKNNLNQLLWSDLFEPEIKQKWNYSLYQPLNRKVRWLELKEKDLVTAQ